LSTSAISRRYAKALVELAAEQKMVEQYGEELSRFGSVLEKEDVLRLLLESPTFPQEKKTTILFELMKVLQLSKGMQNFFGLLLSKGRLKFLPGINDDYQLLADELSGIVRAKITAPTKLNATQKKAITDSLEAATGKKVELSAHQDRNLIGGVKAEIGGKVFDGSVRTQLKRIEDTLKKG